MSILFICCLTAFLSVNIVNADTIPRASSSHSQWPRFRYFASRTPRWSGSNIIDPKTFKRRYIAPYIASLDYRYEISGSFRPAYLRASGPFVDGISYFDCEDKISGVYDGVFFSFADVCVTHTDERRSSRGIFFYAEFKKCINSVAVILPLLSAWPTLGGLKKIAMDDSEFSSAFSVYSADAVSAMYALTPAFMRRLLRFRSGAGGPIRLSFSGRKVYIFIHTGHDSFEPSVDRSVLSFDPAASIKHELLFFLSIVKSLKLNENIWQD